MSRRAWKFYIICIHFILALVLIKSDFIYKVKLKLGAQPEESTHYYDDMVAYHSRIDNNTPHNSVVFIGDSHIQGLAVSAVTNNAVNYGIGGDTTIGVLKRLPYYKSLISSKAVVIEIGFNDLRHRNSIEITENIVKILEYIPDQTKVILCAVHPVGKELHKIYNQRIRGLNSSLEKISNDHINVIFLNTFNKILSTEGYMPSEYLLSDGVHLSTQGYELWITMISEALKKGEDRYE